MKLQASCFQAGRGTEDEIRRGCRACRRLGRCFWDLCWCQKDLFQGGIRTFSRRRRDCQAYRRGL